MTFPNVVDLPAPWATVRNMAVTALEQARDGALSCPVCGAMLRAEHLVESSSGVRCLFCGTSLADEPAGHQGPAVPADIGDVLRRARLARNESLSDASRWTCLQSRYLAALEGNHNVDEFPGRVYARYFLREYAEHLDLDPEPLLRSFDAAGGAEPPEPQRERRPLVKQERSWKIPAIISAVVLAALVVISVIRYAPGGGDEPIARASAAGLRVAAPGAHAHPVSRAEPVASSGLRATLVLNADCWVSITVDGRELPSDTYPAGSTFRYHAKESMDVWLGNAGGVTLEINGERVPTGAQGQPVQLSFVWNDGRVQRQSVL